MPRFYSFFDASGEAMSLQGIDDLVRQVMGLPVDNTRYSTEYEALTWAVLAHDTFDKMIESAKTSNNDLLLRMATGLKEKQITYTTGWCSH